MKPTCLWLIICILLFHVNVSSSQEEISPVGVVWYAREDCENDSSWEKGLDVQGNTSAQTSEFMIVGKYTDSSTLFPIALNRPIRPINRGRFTLEFDFALDRNMNDTTFCLLSETKTVFGLVVKDHKLHLLTPSGEDELCNIRTSTNLDTVIYDIKAHLNMDTKLLEKLYVNGSLIAQDQPFVTDTSSVTSFDVSTGTAATGTFLVRYLRIYSGYAVYETFMAAQVPDDWQTDSVKAVHAFNYRYQDRRSVILNTTDSNVRYDKYFDAVSGRLNFEIQLLIPEKRNKISAALMSAEEPIFAFVAEDNRFFYDANGNTVPFYEALEHVWYHFKAEINLLEGKADVYLNGKLQCENIPINHAPSADSIRIDAEKHDVQAYFDDVILHEIAPLPADYVPIPHKVSTGDYAVGVQKCPLWTEGTHNGWGKIKSAPGREPLLGFYDEGNPEVSDWEIKWMAENGIAFQLICAYTCYPHTSGVRDPIKDTAFRHTYALHNGYFHAQYSDYVDFAILWENAGYHQGNDNYDDFFENLVPFWIEYYFKDARYFKVDGRPILSIYSPENFFSIFQGSTRNDQAVIAGIQKFRNMCVEAGVGNPLIMVSPGASYTKDKLEQYNAVGIDFAAKYNFGSDGIEHQKLYMNNMKEWTGAHTQIVPTCVSGFDSSPWNNKGGFSSSVDEYQALLQWAKDDFIPSLPENNWGKQLVIAATWDEFGEGTYICPTKKYGFGYVNAIRDVFAVNSGEAVNIIPTDAQKRRVNQLTRPDAVADYQVVERLIPEAEGQEISHAWDFTLGPGVWQKRYDVGEFTVQDGKLHVTPSGAYPSITAINLDLPLYQINYIHLSVKVPTATDGKVYWTTQDSQQTNEEKKMVFTAKGGEFEEIYIPVGKSRQWSGQLKELRIMLGTNITDFTSAFEIAKIALLGGQTENYSATIDAIPTHVDTITHDGEPLVSLGDIASKIGGKVSKYIKSRSVMLSLNGVITQLTVEGTIAKSGNKRILLYTAPVAYGGEIYVCANTLMQLCGGVAQFDENGKFTFITGNVTVPVSLADSLYAYHFNDPSELSGFVFKDVSEINVNNGALTLTANGTDPYMKLPVQAFAAGAAKRVIIGMKSDTASAGKLYFMKNNDVNFVYNQYLEFSVQESDSFVEYTLYTDDVKTFSGTITGLRLDPLEHIGTVSIAYIQILQEADVPEIIVESTGEDYIRLTACHEAQYSIDGITWQESSVFNNLAEGKYDVLVRFYGNNLPFKKFQVTVGAQYRAVFDLWDGEVDVDWYDAQENELSIASAAELAGFAALVNSGVSFAGRTIHLTNHIDLANRPFEQIGNHEKPFSGVFNAGGHVIKGLYISTDSTIDGGFIARNNGTIQNLGIEGAQITAQSSNTGVLAGRNNGMIDQCFVRNSMVTVLGTDTRRTGGLVGMNSGQIQNAYTVNISFAGNAPLYGLGSFAGNIEIGATVQNCYAAMDGSSTIPIKRAFAPGHETLRVDNCYYDTVDSAANSAYSAAGVPVINNELQNFVSRLGNAYVRSADVAYNHGYPMLHWEQSLWHIPSDVTFYRMEMNSGISAFKMRNNTTQDKNEIFIIAACYENDSMTAMGIQPISIGAMQSIENPCMPQISLTTADYMKVFCIESLASMQPLSGVHRIAK
jgi:hypothetical protein